MCGASGGGGGYNRHRHGHDVQTRVHLIVVFLSRKLCRAYIMIPAAYIRPSFVDLLFDALGGATAVRCGVKSEPVTCTERSGRDLTLSSGLA